MDHSKLNVSTIDQLNDCSNNNNKEMISSKRRKTHIIRKISKK